MLQAVAAGKRVSWAWSSWTTHGYGRGYPATIALCFRREDGCVVFGAAQGHDKCASPGRVWTELQPWRPGTAATTRKLEAWAKQVSADRLVVPASLLIKSLGLLLQAAKAQKVPKDFSGSGMAFHTLRPGSKLFATNAAERMRLWVRRRTLARERKELSTSLRLFVNKAPTLPPGWKVVSGPPGVGLMIVIMLEAAREGIAPAAQSPAAAPPGRTVSCTALIDEPSLFASLDIWECHLQRLNHLPDDNMQKAGAIELARAMVALLRGKLH